MATNNTESTTTATATSASASASVSENKDNKSLMSKAKDTLVGIKDQVKELFNENNEDDNEVKGMPRKKFEKTKEELESSLHFKQQEELANSEAVKLQNQSGAEFQNQSGANMKDYKEVNQQEFVKAPDVLLQQAEVVDDKKDEVKYAKLDQNESHVLPTIHVKEKPVIIEKEIEFEKPVEVKQTIIHKEKPVIIEKPTIVEKKEHYREETQLEKNNKKIVKESISEQDVGNKDQETLSNLRQERIDTFSDTTPIIKHEKQRVKLDTEMREQPTEIREKEVVYQQPVEIEKKKIEKIKPKIQKNVTLEKEHVYEKNAPEIYQENAKVLEKDKYFSQDTTTATTANIASTDAVNGASYNETREENKQKKEIM